MDELTPTQRDGSGTDQDRSEAQPPLPLELPFDAPLPFDDEVDQPVDLVLTARARRVVAPADLPALRLVPEPADPATSPAGAGASTDGGATDGAVAASRPEPRTGPPVVRHPARVDDDPSDTRPSRARALRRAGRPTSKIAEQLGVDELLVRAWVADVAPRHARRGGDRDPVGGAAVSAPAVAVGHGARGGVTSGSRAESGTVRSEVDEHRTAFELARAAARDEARRERLADPAFAGGIGLLAGVAELDPHAVTVTTVEPEVSAAALRWIREQLPIAPERVRIVLRIGPSVAGDLAAHRWVKLLEVPRERVAVTSWRHAPADDAEQVLLRIADPTAAASIAGWRDALLSPPGDDPADVAF